MNNKRIIMIIKSVRKRYNLNHTEDLAIDIKLENVQFTHDVLEPRKIMLSWSNGQTSLANFQSGDLVSCIERYTLEDETDSMIIITGCQGTAKDMQLMSAKFGQVLCTIHPNGSVEMIAFESGSESATDTSVDSPDFEQEFPERGISMDTRLPTDLELEVVVYITPSFREKARTLGYVEDDTMATQIFHHASMAFLDDSWGETKIHLKALYVHLKVETGSLDTWSDIVPKKQKKVGRLHTLLIGEGLIGFNKAAGKNGTRGIAFTRTVCGE